MIINITKTGNKIDGHVVDHQTIYKIIKQVEEKNVRKSEHK
jgi:hypothetical protein